MQLTERQEDVERINSVGIIIMACMIALQLFVFVGTLIASPGYLLPFLKNPLGLGMLVTACLWEALGIWFATRPASPKVAALKWFLVQTLCVAPVFLAPMLGPAIITIVQALGPPH